MRIGELSQRTQLSPRMLRHYERRGLLDPQRGPNGYRCYDETDVDRAQVVSSLVRAGLPTPLIAAITGMATGGEADPDAEQQVRRLLEAELERLDARIACTTLSRDAVAMHLAAMSRGRPA